MYNILDIMTGVKFSSLYWSGRLNINKGGEGVKMGEGGDRYFSPLQSSLFFIKHENLV